MAGSDRKSTEGAVERPEGAARASEASAERAGEVAEKAARSAGPSARSTDEATDIVGGTMIDDARQRAREEQLLVEFGVDPEDPDLQQEIRRLGAGASEELPYGTPGDPIARTSSFRIGFFGALGVLAAAALGWAVMASAQVLALVVISLFLAVGLDPAVRRLTRRGWDRRRAVAVVATAVGVGMLAFVAVGLPPLVRQANTLRVRAPAYIEQLSETSPTVRQIDQRYGLAGRLREMAADAELLDEGSTDELVNIARGAATAAAATLTVLVLTLYFLAGLPRARLAAERLVPRSRRARAGLLIEGVVERIGGYVLGKLVTALIAGAAAFIVLLLMGVPQAVALAIFVAVTDVIPIVGALLGAALAIAVALTVSPTTAIVVAVFFVVYQQFENLWLMPRVMSQTVDVSPAVTLVAALIGGVLFGAIGALLAVPVAASIKLIIEQVVVPAQDLQ